MTLTLDSSAAYEVLAENTPRAERLAELLAGHDFVVPTLFRYELSNVIRRALSQGALTDHGARLLLTNVLSMPIREFDFEFVLPRAWELRGSFTFTDAAYIAVAEATGTAFVTLDERIARGPAVKCEIIIPPS